MPSHDPRSCSAAFSSVTVSLSIHSDLDAVLSIISRMTQRFRNRQICVVQSHILSDKSDRHATVGGPLSSRASSVHSVRSGSGASIPSSRQTICEKLLLLEHDAVPRRAPGSSGSRITQSGFTLQKSEIFPEDRFLERLVASQNDYIRVRFPFPEAPLLNAGSALTCAPRSREDTARASHG